MASPKFILALDQGTTSSRAIVFDHAGKIVSVSQTEFAQIYPKPGWVEHDPNEIWATQVGAAAEAVSKARLRASDIEAIGITNQRETTIVWDRETGKPIHNAIVWQDRRTAAFCDELKEKNLENIIQEKTGLVIDAYFSATKIKWLLDNIEGAREKANAGQLAFGTIDSWLIWNLTGGEKHVTDVTNASRTLLFNINALEWDTQLIELFEIPASMLPEVCSCSEIIGKTSQSIFSTAIPIAGVAGDQQAALFGQMCVDPGMVKNTYGTGCFMLMNIGDKPLLSKHMLVTTVAWKIGDEVLYALEGSVFIAGAVVQWLRDGLGIIKTSAQVEQLAMQVESTDGLYFVPAFVGLGAPYWDQHARGTMVGITRGTTASHIARAALESIAFQTAELVEAMQADAGIEIRELRADGGATENNLLLQIQADVLGTRVVKPQVTEVTAIGAAYFAGLATGYGKDVDELKRQWVVRQAFEFAQNYPRARRLREWKIAIQSARSRPN